ncbi:MAG: hypothetical protein IJO98_10710 [Clostridia bacterium]|nr:hypothetical protein [Clostridia bacterium]
MMMHSCRNTISENRPVHSAKASASFAFINAARFFSALRFYFYFFFYFFANPRSSEVSASV